MPLSVEAIGWGAASLTTLSFVPQVLRTLRSRDVSGISTGMYAAFCAGVGLWLLYGILIRSIPVVAANALTLALALIVLFITVRENARHDHVDSGTRVATMRAATREEKAS